jgi:hypothetical protein
MGRSRTESANRVTEQMTEAVRESYRAIADSAVEMQERNIRFSRSFFGTCNEVLREQAEANRAVTRSLAEQTQRQQEALRTLARGLVSAYLDFLYSTFPTPSRS